MGNEEALDVKLIVRRYFDSLASSGAYETRDAFFAKYLDERTRVLAGFIARMERRALQILDVGCGDGSQFLRIKRMLPGVLFRYEGCDLSPGMVRLARANSLRATVADMVDLAPFPDSTYDVVMALGGSLGFLPDTKQRVIALREFRRLVKPSGIVALDVFFRDEPKDWLYTMEGRGALKGWIHEFAKGQICELMSSSRFNIVHYSTHETHLPGRKDGPELNYNELVIAGRDDEAYPEG